MDTQTFVDQIRSTHAALEAAAAALDEAGLLGQAPGMDGWTRKDVLAHVEWRSDHSSDVLA